MLPMLLVQLPRSHPAGTVALIGVIHIVLAILYILAFFSSVRAYRRGEPVSQKRLYILVASILIPAIVFF